MVAGFRNYAIAKNLKSRFDEVHVITSKKSNIVQQDKLDIAMFQLSPILNLDYRTLSKGLRKIWGHKKQKTKVKNQIIGIWVRKLLDSFPTNILFGEGGLLYIILGFFKAMQLIRQERIRFIFSSYRPYSDHLIAFLVKLFYPSIYWVADFADLQIDPVIKNVYWVDFQHWCNKKILSKANLLSTVSKGLATRLKPYHSNIFVLRNGISLPLSSISSSKEKPPFFRIVYTGSLYGNRTALPLFEILHRLLDEKKIHPEHLKITYAGKDSSIWKTWAEPFRMEKYLDIKGLLPLEQAHQLQQSASINVMLSWASTDLTGWLTFKFYEYLAAGKPILCLVNGSKDEELEEILYKHRAGSVFYVKEKQGLMKQFILKNYQQWLQTGEVKRNKADWSEYTWEWMMDCLFEKIEKEWRMEN